jgi:hypothetical protein
MMMRILVLACLVGASSAYNVVSPTTKATVTAQQQQQQHQSSASTSSRRSFAAGLVAAASGLLTATTTTSQPQAALAFDGSGSSAYSGYNPATKAELKKAYKVRIAADVYDFNVLGEAIISKGETAGPAWTNFFIQFARREPDEFGRAYAALVDLRGLPINKKEFEGGDGMLLANTFTKAGKPPDNTPAVIAFKKLIRAFDPIEEAGKKGDVAKAKAEFQKAVPLLSAYLTSVELPGDLNDPSYQ